MGSTVSRIFYAKVKNPRWKLSEEAKRVHGVDRARYVYGNPPEYHYEVRLVWALLSWLAKVALVLGAIGLVVGSIAYGAIALARTECRENAEQMGLEWDHGVWSGCQVLTDEGWRDKNSIRVGGGDT